MPFLVSLLRAGWERRSQVGGWLLTLLVAALLPTSCLTPDFDFSERDIGPGGSGPVSHCENRTKDADETDIDCGGIDCPPCALGRDCRADGDCVNDSCTGGRCQSASCVDDVRNGTETDVDCGGAECAPCEAGKKCAKGADCASTICKSGTCAEASCTDRVKNGGEIDVDCGGPCEGCEVGKACVLDGDCKAPPDDAAAECDDGRCTLVCASGTADCNERASDGCEVNTDADLSNCGGCGEVCAPANAQGVCDEGVCRIDFDGDGCAAGFEDCDGDAENGCEVNVTADGDNCGACDRICGGSAQTNVASASCSSGSCSVSCATGFCPNTSDPERKCTLPLGTTSNCLSCGDVCSGATPYCTAEGCKAYLPIEVVNDDTDAVSSTTDLTFTHQLQTPAAANAFRAVVLLLGNKANPDGLPPVVNYAGQPMEQIVNRYDNQAWAGIYYQLSEDLPSEAGNHTVSLVPTGLSGSQRWAARVIELINVHQSSPWIDRGLVSHGGSACGPTASVVKVTTGPGAWVASILTEARALKDNPAPTGINVSALPVLTTSASTVSQGYAFATGNSLSVSWSGCAADAWSHVLLVLRPEGQAL